MNFLQAHRELLFFPLRDFVGIKIIGNLKAQSYEGMANIAGHPISSIRLYNFHQLLPFSDAVRYAVKYVDKKEKLLISKLTSMFTIPSDSNPTLIKYGNYIIVFYYFHCLSMTILFSWCLMYNIKIKYKKLPKQILLKKKKHSKVSNSTFNVNIIKLVCTFYANTFKTASQNQNCCPQYVPLKRISLIKECWKCLGPANKPFLISPHLSPTLSLFYKRL